MSRRSTARATGVLRAAALLGGGAACVAACPAVTTAPRGVSRPHAGLTRPARARAPRTVTPLPPATPAGAQCGFGVEARAAPGALARAWGGGEGAGGAVGITAGARGALRVWLGPAPGAPFEAVELEDTGEAAGGAALGALFAQFREVSELRVAGEGALVAEGGAPREEAEGAGVVATAWPDDRDSEVVFAAVDAEGRVVSPPAVLDASPRPDREPVIARAPLAPDRYAVAWARGGGDGHPADIEFALVERGGRVVTHATLATRVDPEGMALVATAYGARAGADPGRGGVASSGVASNEVVSNGVASNGVRSAASADAGAAAAAAAHADAAVAAPPAHTGPAFVLVYTPGGDARHSTVEPGVVAIVLGADGAVLAQHTVARGQALWPVAAWDGEAVGVAFRWEPRRIGFVRLAPDGAVRTPPTEIARLADPLGTFHPAAMVFDRGRFWVGSAAYFHGALARAAPSRSYVVAVAPDGTAAPPLVLPPSPRGTEGPLLAATPGGVRGVFGTSDPDAGDAPVVRAFDLVCRAAPGAVAQPAPQGPCDPRLVRFAPARHAPLRTSFRLAPARGGELLVAYEAPDAVTPASVPAGEQAPAPLALARLAADGLARWTLPLSREAGARRAPALAASDDDAAAVYSPDEDLVFVAVDPVAGRERARRTVRARAGLGAPSAYCLAPRASNAGYLLVWSGDEGVVALRLRRDGAEDGATALPDAPAFSECALARTEAGFWLALTRPGLAPGARDLYLQPLDAQDAPVGAPVPLAAGFVRDPVMVRAPSGGLLLAWGDERAREVLALELRASDGAAVTAAPRVLAEGYTLRGLGLVTDAEPRPRLVWSTEGGFGERRVCPAPPLP